MKLNMDFYLFDEVMKAKNIKNIRNLMYKCVLEIKKELAIDDNLINLMGKFSP